MAVLCHSIWHQHIKWWRPLLRNTAGLMLCVNCSLTPVHLVITLKLIKRLPCSLSETRLKCVLSQIVTVTRLHWYNNVISLTLVLGAVDTTINDRGFQHVTGRFESIRMLLRWPTFFQRHPSVKTVEWFKNQLPRSLPTCRKREN